MSNTNTKNASNEDEAGARLQRGLMLMDFEASKLSEIEYAFYRTTRPVRELKSNLELARKERDETTGAIGDNDGK